MAHWRIYFDPHCDDGELSMGIHRADMRARGENILVVYMSLGGNTGARNTLNGAAATPPVNGCVIHGYQHDPEKEFYDGAPLLEAEEIRQSRLKESVSALGALATIPTLAGVTPGEVAYEEGGLLDGFGGGSLPALADAVDQCEAIMRDVYSRYPNSFLYTMSESDQHPDHQACGKALKRMRESADLGPALVNSRFFVSKLYWKENQGGSYPQYVLDAAANGPNGASTLAWYGAANVQVGPSGSRYTELSNILRNRVIKPYGAWSPKDGVYGVARHSVNDQFENCLGANVNIQCLMHQ